MIDAFVSSIPKSIAELIASRTPEQAYSEMIENGKASISDILTFCLVVTPIYIIETDILAGYVSFWHNKNVISTDENGRVLGMEVGRGYVTGTEAVEIFERHLRTKEEA